MKYDLLILGVDFVLILLSILTFYTKLRKDSDLFYLVAICSLFFGGISGFLYGFPLEEGTVPENQIGIYERGAVVSSILFLLSMTLLFLLILKYYRVKK